MATFLSGWIDIHQIGNIKAITHHNSRAIWLYIYTFCLCVCAESNHITRPVGLIFEHLKRFMSKFAVCHFKCLLNTTIECMLGWAAVWTQRDKLSEKSRSPNSTHNTHKYTHTRIHIHMQSSHHRAKPNLCDSVLD